MICSAQSLPAWPDVDEALRSYQDRLLIDTCIRMLVCEAFTVGHRKGARGYGEQREAFPSLKGLSGWRYVDAALASLTSRFVVDASLSLLLLQAFAIGQKAGLKCVVQEALKIVTDTGVSVNTDSH